MFAKILLASIPHSIRTIRCLAASCLESEITFQQFRVLNLADEGMGQTQMSQTLQVSTAAISKMIDSLVKRGFLERGQGPDRRCLKLKLTREGKKIRKLVMGQTEKHINENISKLTKDDQADLEKGLKILDKLMGHINEK